MNRHCASSIAARPCKKRKDGAPSVGSAQSIPCRSLGHPSTNCKSGQAGWAREVLKIVTDQNGADIVLVGQNLDETVTITSPNQLNLSAPTTGTATTDGNGHFTDTFFLCSPKCPGTGQTDASQTISDVMPSGAGPYNLSPNTLVYQCSNITVNGQ
jgi:hypothetical protein